MTIVEFLRARQDAREARWRALLVEAQRVTLALQEPRLLGRVIPGWHTWPEVEALASEALADVEVKRRIVDEHQSRNERASWAEDILICRTCRYDGGLDWILAPCPTLRLLALPFDTHPDYDPTWSPA